MHTGRPGTSILQLLMGVAALLSFINSSAIIVMVAFGFAFDKGHLKFACHRQGLWKAQLEQSGRLYSRLQEFCRKRKKAGVRCGGDRRKYGHRGYW